MKVFSKKLEKVIEDLLGKKLYETENDIYQITVQFKRDTITILKWTPELGKEVQLLKAVLPERVVHMTVPEWVSEYVQASTFADFSTPIGQYVFESEVNNLLERYKKSLTPEE